MHGIDRLLHLGTAELTKDKKKNMQEFYRNLAENLWVGLGQPVQKRVGATRTFSQYFNYGWLEKKIFFFGELFDFSYLNGRRKGLLEIFLHFYFM